MSENDSPVTTFKYPDRESWLQARQSSLGGSETPQILGQTKYGSPMDIYAKKLGLVTDTVSDQEAAKMGLLLEPIVADLYTEATGLPLVNPGPWAIVRHKAYPHLHASPDRYIEHPDRGMGVLSIKTASAYKRAEWTEEAPPAYQIQLQQEMLLRDVSWGAVAVLIGGQMFRYIDVIERDDAFCKRLADYTLEFWVRIQRRTPPAADYSEACRKVLAQLYPVDSGETMALPVELVSVDEDYLEAAAEVKKWEERKTLAENTLRAALQTATKGILPNGVAWTNKAQTRKEYVVPENTFRVLRRTKKG